MSIPGMKSTADFAPDERIGVGIRDAAPLRLLSALVGAQQGVEYFAVVRAAGGREPYTYQLFNAPGLKVDHSGWLTGTPTAGGTALLRVFSADGQSASQQFSIAADIPEIVYTLYNADGNVDVELQAIVGALVAFDSLDRQIQALRLTTPIINGAIRAISLDQPLIAIVGAIQAVIDELRAAQPVPAISTADTTLVAADSTEWTADGAGSGVLPEPSAAFWSNPFWTRTPFWSSSQPAPFIFWSNPFWTRNSFWGA